jgi:hypothetical protein
MLRPAPIGRNDPSVPLAPVRPPIAGRAFLERERGYCTRRIVFASDQWRSSW